MLNSSDIKPGTPLSAFTAADFKSVLDAVRRASEVKVAPPLERINNTITLAQPEGFWATLSGASSPYSFTEKYGATGGAWTTRVRTGTTNAYEVNGISGLSGKTVFLRPGFPGDYRFQYVAASSSGGGCTGGSITITVRGCNNIAIPGASVTITGPGGFSSSGTTNSSGQYTASLIGSPTGTYSATASMTRFNNGSTSVVVTFCIPNSGTITLAPATGFRCTACPTWAPAPETLRFTTSFGVDVALVYDIPFIWRGQFTYLGTNYNVDFGALTGTACNLTTSYQNVGLAEVSTNPYVRTNTTAANPLTAGSSETITVSEYP